MRDSVLVKLSVTRRFSLTALPLLLSLAGGCASELDEELTDEEAQAEIDSDGTTSVDKVTRGCSAFVNIESAKGVFTFNVSATGNARAPFRARREANGRIRRCVTEWAKSPWNKLSEMPADDCSGVTWSLNARRQDFGGEKLTITYPDGQDRACDTPNVTQVYSGVYYTRPPLTMQWFVAGSPPAYQACTQWYEPEDPHAWADNYVCTNKNTGLRFSYGGPIPGMQCVSVNEPSDRNGWWDNYACIPNNQPYRLLWSARGNPAPGSDRCLNLNEPADPASWEDNYLCIVDK